MINSGINLLIRCMDQILQRSLELNPQANVSQRITNISQLAAKAASLSSQFPHTTKKDREKAFFLPHTFHLLCFRIMSFAGKCI